MHSLNEFRETLTEPGRQPLAVAEPESLDACARPPSAILRIAARHGDSAETEAEPLLVTFLRAFAVWHT
jgi:hypothetical protein